MSKAIVTGQPVSDGFLHRLEPIDPRAKSSLANRIGNRAKTELDILREEATQEGWNEGYMEGYTAGQQSGFAQGQAEGRQTARFLFNQQFQSELDKLAADMGEMRAQAQVAFDHWATEAEQKLAGLAIAIAEEALAEELAISRESIIAITQRAMREILGGTQVQIRINPLDAGLMEARLQDATGTLVSVKGVEVVPDKTIEYGCRLVTEAEVIDATVEGYLDRLKEEMDEAA